MGFEGLETALRIIMEHVTHLSYQIDKVDIKTKGAVNLSHMRKDCDSMLRGWINCYGLDVGTLAQNCGTVVCNVVFPQLLPFALIFLCHNRSGGCLPLIDCWWIPTYHWRCFIGEISKSETFGEGRGCGFGLITSHFKY